MTTLIPSSTSSSEPALATGFFRSRPWLWVVLAFTLLLSAWTALFYIAIQNQPEVIPLKQLVP